MRFSILIILCFITQFSFAQTDNFQGKLVYKLSFEGISENENFNQAMIEKTKEQIGNVDSVSVFIRDKYFRTELKAKAVTQYW